MADDESYTASTPAYSDTENLSGPSSSTGSAIDLTGEPITDAQAEELDGVRSPIRITTGGLHIPGLVPTAVGDAMILGSPLSSPAHRSSDGIIANAQGIGQLYYQSLPPPPRARPTYPIVTSSSPAPTEPNTSPCVQTVRTRSLVHMAVAPVHGAVPPPNAAANTQPTHPPVSATASATHRPAQKVKVEVAPVTPANKGQQQASAPPPVARRQSGVAASSRDGPAHAKPLPVVAITIPDLSGPLPDAESMGELDDFAKWSPTVATYLDGLPGILWWDRLAFARFVMHQDLNGVTRDEILGFLTRVLGLRSDTAVLVFNLLCRDQPARFGSYARSLIGAGNRQLM